MKRELIKYQSLKIKVSKEVIDESFLVAFSPFSIPFFAKSSSHPVTHRHLLNLKSEEKINFLIVIYVNYLFIFPSLFIGNRFVLESLSNIIYDHIINHHFQLKMEFNIFMGINFPSILYSVREGGFDGSQCYNTYLLHMNADNEQRNVLWIPFLCWGAGGIWTFLSIK